LTLVLGHFTEGKEGINRENTTKSEIFVWVGSAGILLSAVLGIVAVFFPAAWLIIISLALGGISAPAAILSARYAASEEQKRFEYLYIRTPEGRQRSALAQLRAPMERTHE
jgi:hypothetical protein